MTVQPQNAAFPSSSVWYVACGFQDEAGGGGSSGGSGSAASAQQWVHQSRSDLYKSFVNKAMKAGNGRSMQMVPTLYYGQVLKTADSGKTWSSVFEPVQGMEMMLGIDCSSTTTCCTSAQAYNGTTIRCTYDGGNTWSVNYNVTSPRAAIFDVRYIDNEWWAIGGQFETPYHLDAYTTVLHSADNGKTWTVDTKLSNVFGVALDIAADGSNAMFGVGYSNPATDDAENYNVILAAQ